MKRLPLLLLLLVVAGFIFGLTQLFKLRFERGDVYPEYSTLRADPVGAKAIFESFDQLLPTRRNYRPLAKIEDARGAALVFLGVEPDDLRMTAGEFKELEQCAIDGGRVVIALYPSYENPNLTRFRKSVAANIKPGGGKTNAPPNRKPAPGEDELDAVPRISLKDRWGVGIDFAPVAKAESGAYQPVAARRLEPSALPESIQCHTALYFDSPGTNWQVLYARAPLRPVLLERKFGRGTIALAADSYYFSNEAMLKDRQPALLAWFVGPGRSVIFDETHLGTAEDPGIASLARKYRLHGFFAGLLALTALFIWKNSVSFIPPHEEEARRERGDLVTGKESAAGFVNLLRRNIPNRDLLAACILEWKKSFAHATSASKLAKIQAVIDAENGLPEKQRSPVRTYQSISKILSKRKA